LIRVEIGEKAVLQIFSGGLDNTRSGARYQQFGRKNKGSNRIKNDE
jgi:hypothetical protein